MSKPRLPDRLDEAWEGGFVLDTAQRVRDVSGSGGLVLAGGDALLMLRPGSQNWKQRPAVGDIGAAIAVAAEQAPPWRYAVAWSDGVTIFGLPNDQKLTLRPENGDLQATHLAWARFGKESALHVRWDDGTVGRLRLDLGTMENLHVAPVDAIASDVNGVLALVAAHCDAGDAHALFTLDGIRFEERPATATPEGVPPEARVHLAVAGAAIAYAVEGWGAHLSRGVDDDFVPCEGLMGGGPLAFQGSTADAALFGAGRDRGMCVIHRLDGKGAVQRILELDGEGGEAPTLSAMAWDRSRHVLWSASPQAGLLRSEEPKGKGGKKRSLS